MTPETFLSNATAWLTIVPPIAGGIIFAYFKIKAMIDEAKAEAKAASAANSARIDQHDIISGVVTVPAATPPVGSIVLGVPVPPAQQPPKV